MNFIESIVIGCSREHDWPKFIESIWFTCFLNGDIELRAEIRCYACLLKCDLKSTIVEWIAAVWHLFSLLNNPLNMEMPQLIILIDSCWMADLLHFIFHFNSFIGFLIVKFYNKFIINTEFNWKIIGGKSSNANILMACRNPELII